MWSAIVLSVSLLATLITKPFLVTAVRWLYWAWGCLLASLVCATFRNRFRAEHEWAGTFASEAQDSISEYEKTIQSIADGLVVPVSNERLPIPTTEAINNLLTIRSEIWDWTYRTASRRSRRFKALFSSCEWVAQLGFVLGMVLLLGFAIRNAAAYTSTAPLTARSTSSPRSVNSDNGSPTPSVCHTPVLDCSMLEPVPVGSACSCSAPNGAIVGAAQ